MHKTVVFLSLLLSLLLVLSGCALKDTLLDLFPEDAANPLSGEASADSTPAESIPAEIPTAQETVYCLIGITAQYNGEIQENTVTYDADGIHLLAVEKADQSDVHYNWAGQIVTDISYNSEGVESYVNHFTYDDAGRIVQTKYTRDGEVTSASTYIYNDQGLLTRLETTLRNDSYGGHNDYFYNEQGQLIQRDYYNYEGVHVLSYYYTYNEAGRYARMEEIYSEEYGGPSGYYTYTYDGNNRLLNKIWHSEVSYATSGDYYYTYDASGLLIGYEKWAFGEQKEHCGFSYSSDGFLLEYSDIIDGYCVTFLYGEISLDEAIAESAAEWSRSGVRALYASDPE